jgi:predicted nucleic acid-binding Zn ribbon protein
MKRRRARQKLDAPEPLEQLLDRAGESRFARMRSPLPERVWRDAVGARIADRARPVAMERGVLLVRVATSVWAHELSLLSTTILARLRERGVETTELRFRVGAIDPPERPPERVVSRAVPASAPLPPELANALADVADGELRESIARAASANLAWQKTRRR